MSAILRFPKVSTVSTQRPAHPSIGTQGSPAIPKGDKNKHTWHGDGVQVFPGDARACNTPLPNVVNAKLLGRATRPVQSVYFSGPRIIEQAEAISDSDGKSDHGFPHRPRGNNVDIPSKPTGTGLSHVQRCSDRNSSVGC
jgi:hypothetical protein